MTVGGNTAGNGEGGDANGFDGDSFDSFADGAVPPPPPPEESGSRGGSSRFKDRPDRSRGFSKDRTDLTEYRQPPHDRQAEQGVLGAMLLSASTVVDVTEELQPEDFYYPAHQLIYQAILELYSQGSDIDVLIVAGRLDRMGNLERVGGAPYLHTLISEVPTAANARYYADIVAEKSTLRQLVDAGTRVAQLGYEGGEGMEVDALVDRAQQEIFSVAQKQTGEDYRPLSELLKPTVDELAAYEKDGGLAAGVPTGFIDLDRLTNGLHAGQMIIIAARPGVGKSTLAMDFVRSCSIHNGLTSVIFSLEMSASEIVMRLLSAETEIKLSAMRSGQMEEKDWEKLTDRLQQIQAAPIFVDDSPNLTMMEIRSKARAIKRQHGLDLVVLDLSLIHISEPTRPY